MHNTTPRDIVAVTVCLVILLTLTDQGLSLLGISSFGYRPILQLAVTTMSLYFSLDIVRLGYREWQLRIPGTYLLTSVALGAGYSTVLYQMLLYTEQNLLAIELTGVAWVTLITIYGVGLLQTMFAIPANREDGIQSYIQQAVIGFSVSAFSIAALTFLVWLLYIDKPLDVAIFFLISVMVIPSLQALLFTSNGIYRITADAIAGLGVGMQYTNGLDRLIAARHYILDEHSFPDLCTMRVVSVTPFSDWSKEDAMVYAASLCQSSHTSNPYKSLIAYAEKKGVVLKTAMLTATRAEHGIHGLIDDIGYAVGTKAYMKHEGLWTKEAELHAARTMISDTTNIIYVGDIVVRAAIVLSTGNFINRLRDALPANTHLIVQQNYHETTPTKESVLFVSSDYPEGISTHFSSSFVVRIPARSPDTLIQTILAAKAYSRTLKIITALAILYNALAIPLASGILFTHGIVITPSVAAALALVSGVTLLIPLQNLRNTIKKILYKYGKSYKSIR